MLKLNFNDSTLWAPVWQLDVSQPAGSNNSHIRIPEQVCPIILHNPILAISASNPQGSSEWISAGFLSQNIRSPLIVGGSFTTHVTSRQILLRTEIIYFLDVKVADYAIAFKCRFWHKQIQLIVWEYQGILEPT